MLRRYRQPCRYPFQRWACTLRFLILSLSPADICEKEKLWRDSVNPCPHRSPPSYRRLCSTILISPGRRSRCVLVSCSAARRKLLPFSFKTHPTASFAAFIGWQLDVMATIKADGSLRLARATHHFTALLQRVRTLPFVAAFPSHLFSLCPLLPFSLP